VVVAARTSSDEIWSEPRALAELIDRDSKHELEKPRRTTREELGLPLEFDDDLVLGHDAGNRRPAGDGRLEVLDDLPDDSAPITSAPATDSRDFARQLRAKMSMMAQRLFRAPIPPRRLRSGAAPRLSTEIDLACSGKSSRPAGVSPRSKPGRRRANPRDIVTSPGSWDSQVRERARTAAECAASPMPRWCSRRCLRRLDRAGRFRIGDVEKVVFFDRAGRYSRQRAADRMVSSGARGQDHASSTNAVRPWSPSRGADGEILVDSAATARGSSVRRHVEDIVYSLFGWDHGTYHIVADVQPSAERIRLSRHPASLVLEGIRRKLDRTSLERLVGPPSTVIEVRDRERLGGIINMGDLAPEERGALAAFDGQADLAHVARTAGVDVADVLPLAWGLCVLGLATARRTDTEVPEESTALVGETDLAIDRERVRAAGSSSRKPTTSRCSACAAMPPRSRSGARTSRRAATSPPTASPTTCAASSRRSSMTSRMCSTRHSASCATIACGSRTSRT
jgi:hypothetical protein